MALVSLFSFFKKLADEIFWDGKEDPTIIPGRKVVHRSPRLKDRTGIEGENLAADWYKKNSCRILERNLKLPSCEIDLILQDKETIVFAEVKTRRNEDRTDPYIEVPPDRRDRMRRAKNEYLRWKTFPRDTSCRFDIVVILLTEGKLPDIRHYKDAF